MEARIKYLEGQGNKKHAIERMKLEMLSERRVKTRNPKPETLQREGERERGRKNGGRERERERECALSASSSRCSARGGSKP